MKQKKNGVKASRDRKFKYTWKYLDGGYYENDILLSDGRIKNIEKASRKRKTKQV